MLQIKIRPGQRIAIGDNVMVDVVLDDDRKLALRISAPSDHRIARVPVDVADIPQQNGAGRQI